jgi:hypothetical protein
MSAIFLVRTTATDSLVRNIAEVRTNIAHAHLCTVYRYSILYIYCSHETVLKNLQNMASTLHDSLTECLTFVIVKSIILHLNNNVHIR